MKTAKHSSSTDLPSKIVEATLKLMETADARHISFREIAGKAGVSHMAPYRHFKNKEEILARIAEQGHELVANSVDAALDEFPLDPQMQLIQAGYNYLDFAMKHPKHLQIMYGGVGTQILKKHAELQKSVDRSRMAVLRVIRNCQLNGILPKKQSSEELATMFWSLVHGMTLLEINTEFIGFSSRPKARHIIKTGIVSMVRGLCK